MKKDTNRLRLAKKALESGSYDRKTIEYIFPELKESEDERIRNGLIGYFRAGKCENISSYHGISTNDILAWLEKQSEHANFRDKIQIGDKVTRNEDGMLVKRIAKKDEKQDEQEPADEAKPKFKVGDWVIDKNGIVKQILSYKDCIYKHTDGYSSKMFEDEWRLWDITKDAKEGDILIHNECTFIFMGIKDGIVQALEENLLDGTNPVPFGEPSKGKDYYYPAIKEQRDALIKAMADAGYTFDFEKRELKKIEQKHTPKHKVGDTIYYNSFGEVKSMIVANIVTDNTDNPMYEDENGSAVFEKDLVEQKPTWSEEDEQFLLVCKNALAKYQVSDKWDASIISQWLENRLKPLRFQSSTNTGETH
jgi:hypothetical protein